MPGMPAFWAPAGPQPRRLTWGRARARQRTQKKQHKKSSPQASPETQTQQNTVNGSVLWLGSRARAPKSPKTNGKKARTAQRASQPQQEQNGQNNSPTLSAAVFLRYLQRFGERGPSITGMPGSAWRKNEPRLYPSDTFLKTVLHGLRGFLEGSLDDADQAPLKHHPGPTPDPDDVSHMA